MFLAQEEPKNVHCVVIVIRIVYCTEPNQQKDNNEGFFTSKNGSEQIKKISFYFLDTIHTNDFSCRNHSTHTHHKKCSKFAFNAVMTRTMGPDLFSIPDSVAEKDANLYFANIPDAEALRVSKICDDPPSMEDMKKFIAKTRSSNRICNRWSRGCKDGRAHNLLRCQNCHLTFWCSDSCKAADKESHEKWCLQKDAVDVDSPLRMQLIQIKE